MRIALQVLYVRTSLGEFPTYGGAGELVNCSDMIGWKALSSSLLRYRRGVDLTGGARLNPFCGGRASEEGKGFDYIYEIGT